MFNELAVVAITGFSGGGPDKNGLPSVMLNAVAGKIPNRNVRAGTIAQNKAVHIGESYLVQFRETQPDPQFGRQFDFLVLKANLSIKDIIEARAELGEGEAVPIEKPENADKIPSGTGELEPAVEQPAGVQRERLVAETV